MENRDQSTPASGQASQRGILISLARRAMTERGMEPDFPPAVQQELAALAAAPLAAANGLRDLRDLLWASIDNDDSRDLDQLSVAEPLQGGRVRVLVAIADVDLLVGKGSAIDAHAANNTTSVYTPAAVFPMLPAALSTNLTSLNDQQDRAAVVTDMIFDEQGSLQSSDVYGARVRNRAKLAYSSVAAWLEGTAPAPVAVTQVPGLDENLRLQERLAQRLLNLRNEHGALAVETLEVHPIFRGEELSEVSAERKSRAKQMIEDLMIAANSATAAFLEAKKFPSLRRVLRAPERWDRIVELAAALGEHLPTAPDAAALHAFLARRRAADPAKFPDLSLAVIKLIGRGEYALDLPGGESLGHFGLAVKDYTHSTAPNRRFPDLVTQRLVKAAMAGAPWPYGTEELNALAEHCTRREDDANKVERRVRKSAVALLLSRRIGEVFNAIVTGAAQKGTWVRVFHPPAEGRVVSGFAGLDVGDHVRVRLVETDVEKGFIDFARIP